MHILVTGGCGFIGSHIVEYHLNKGDKVHCVDDLTSGSLENIAPFRENPNFHFDEADILVWSELEKAVRWADRIYHMAAVVGMYRVLAEPVKVLAVNIPGTERILRAAANSQWKPRILIASSSEVYGPQDRPHVETDNLVIEFSWQNRINYAISKITCESFGLSYSRKFGLPITLIRLFNTIGPRQTGRYGMVVPRLVKQAVEGKPITVFGDGEQTRCFCDVRDTVRALDIIADNKDSAGEVINVGTNNEVSINFLANMICEKTKTTSQIEHIPYEIAYGQEFNDYRRRIPNLDKFFAFTQFKYEWNLDKTIEDLIRSSRN